MSQKFKIAPDGSRVCALLKPIVGTEGEITSIILRKPKYREIMQFGDPSSLILMDGALLPHEDMGIVEKYVNSLSGDQTGAKLIPDLLNQLEYQDALALKDAVLSFFKPAEATASSADVANS